MKLLLLLAVLPYMFAAPSLDLNMARALQAGVDKHKPTKDLFRSFKEVFGKKYEDDNEEYMRMEIFETNVKIIREHNLRYEKNESTYFLGVNQFSDLTHKEFLALYTSKVAMDTEKLRGGCSTFLTPSNILMSDQVDWRKKGYVTPVKDQGQCGSCWAFSSTGSLEGQHFKKTGKLVSLSEQQLVDCSTSLGNQGCNGGLQELAFKYIKQAGGIEGETDYTYKAKDGYCKFNSKYIRATDTGYVCTKQGSESSLKAATATVGPISVSIDASISSFQSYRGGIYYEPSCSKTKLDHAVLVVGYGSESAGDYWIVKNSWATTWGIDGYIHMARNRNNNCGIATSPLYPTV